MAKVLLINPPSSRVGSAHLPLGLLSNAAMLEKHNHEVLFCDMNRVLFDKGNPYEYLRDFLKDIHFDIAATGGPSVQFKQLRRTIRILSESFNGALVLGGAIVTSMPHEIQQYFPTVNHFVAGEGEIALTNIAGWSCFSSGNRLKLIVGSVGPDLDVLPFPAWHLVDMEAYFKHSATLMSEESMTAKRRVSLEASRGCSMRCKFCFRSIEGIRFHSVKYIIAMAQEVQDRYQADFFSFVDENISAASVDWLRALSRAWARKHLPKCGSTAHASLITDEKLVLMAGMGMSYLDYGLESFDDRILKEMRKGSTAEINKKAIRMTWNHGIRPIPNLIIGFPSEDELSINRMIEAMKELGIVSKPFICTPYPGSEYFKEFRPWILEQAGGMKKFLEKIGEATDPPVTVCKAFNLKDLKFWQDQILLESKNAALAQGR